MRFISRKRGTFLAIRMSITRTVSKTGTANTAIKKLTEYVPRLLEPSYCKIFNIKALNMTPKTKDPPSPINILYFRPNTLCIKKGTKLPLKTMLK